MYSLGIVAKAIDPAATPPSSSSATEDGPPPPKKRRSSSKPAPADDHRRRINGSLFEFLPDIRLAQFLGDIRKSSIFSLETVLTQQADDTEEQKYLSVFLTPTENESTLSLQDVRAKYRLLDRFFVLPTPREVDQPIANDLDWDLASTNDGPESQISEDSIRGLYESLRESHSKQSVEIVVTEDRPPPGLIPELRFYQLDAVNWMLAKERVSQFFPTEYVEIAMRSDVTKRFFFNERTLDLADVFPGDLRIPSGGILADEMGLGKTVEMLAVILSNRRVMTSDIGNVPGNVSRVESKNKAAPVFCICSSKSKRNLIKCPHCQLYQHVDCVDKHKTRSHLTDYRCPECWAKTTSAPIPSAATFIVSPTSIKMQWQKEVAKHVSSDGFKVLVYDGIKRSGWFSPRELAAYDLILTDYSVLSDELYFLDSIQRPEHMRRQPQYMNPKSPLTMVEWWRVCLDEAQMIETALNRSSKMVKLLPAVHRWSITGTPIEKSVDNLYGLLYFLGCEPYDDLATWKQLSKSFHIGNSQPLVDVLRRIMWRTCKSTVWNRIGIPPQTGVLHMVDMSDLQTFFYSTQHDKCAEAFRQKAARLGTTTSMFRMNPSTLKSIMEPLRKLRQDCTVPTVMNKSHQGVAKRLLSPEELHKHLVSNHEIECKSQLRALTSSLNGLAAICVINCEYENAIKHYKHLLRWANDYTGTISVDSLLQVHALHNLLDVLKLSHIVDPDQDKYQLDLVRLETKYMTNCSELIAKNRDKQQTAERAIEKLSQQLDSDALAWWSHLLFEHLNGVQQKKLIERIGADLGTAMPGSERHYLESAAGISFVLSQWLDQIEEHRQGLSAAFERLQFFARNVKARDQLSADQVERIEHFVQVALACHLDLKLKMNEDYTDRSNKITCELCKVKGLLLRYECVLFNKTIVDSSEEDSKGTWNPTYQENMLKACLVALKNTFPNLHELVRNAETHLAMIEAIKNEYKDYSSYFMEINYAAAAYDELNMCKSRLKACDPDELDDDEDMAGNKLLISKYEVDLRSVEFQQEYTEAEMKFVRLQGTLKYLRHLDKKSGTPDVCPICNIVPDVKYAVLECGHLLCIVCLLQLQMNSHNKSLIECALCRHRQRYSQLYYVNCRVRPSESTNPSELINIVGDYSRKVETIVQTVLQLKRDETSVKIIVFSHWDNILGVIGKALRENDIVFRTKSTVFHKSLDDFRSPDLNVTCLLLPLSSGSKGLNLIEATHVFLVEPILNPAEELQAVGRVHRIGQTRPTFVHRFIVRNTIEQKIHDTISNDNSGRWQTKAITVKHLEELFNYDVEPTLCDDAASV